MSFMKRSRHTITLIIAGIGLIIVGGFYILNTYIYNAKQAPTASDYKDAEYVIDGERVRLADGTATTSSAPDSSAHTTTQYFGNDVIVDFNGDGRQDVAFLLSRDTGGSGVFYYLVAALQTDRGYVGSEGYFIGDRIAPQTVEVSRNPSHRGVIVVNYAERAPGEPMSAQPSVGKSVWLKLDPVALQFGEVVQNFEGEADPARMTLDMKTWVWVSALYNDGREIVPKEPGRFTATFGPNGMFGASTDCNHMGGTYQAADGQIAFGPLISTLMYCEGSQEQEFAQLIENASGYHFTSKGELILDLKFDSGSATFR